MRQPLVLFLALVYCALTGPAGLDAQPAPRQLDAATRQGLLPQLRQSPTSVMVGGMPLQRRRAAMDKRTMVIVSTAHGDSAVPIPEVDVYFSGTGATTMSPLVLIYDRSTDALTVIGDGIVDVAQHLPISCGVSDGDAPPVSPPAAMDPVVLSSKPLLQLELAVETDDTFFTMVGGTVEKAQTYLAALYTVVSALYEDEIHVTIHLSNVRIWKGDPADPYQAKGDPFKLRDAMAPYWKNNYNTVKRDVFQGLTASTWGGGGFGYFDGLCGKNGDFGFSTASVKATDNLTSFGFVYDVYIVAHELGHNFNAVHTHDCYWAPPIDTCIAADGISAGCLPAGQKPLPNPGSIMSYCANANLDAGLGYSMRMTFLPRVMALMRQTVEAATCVHEPPTPTVRLMGPRGNEVFTAGDTTTIRWRASSDVGQVDLAYSRNAGVSWVPISTFIDAADEAFVWTLPEICSNTMLVRIVQSTNSSIADTSIRTFTIKQVNDPNGLVAWYPFNGTTNDSASCGYYPLAGVAAYGADRSNTAGRAATFNGTSSLVAKNFVADFTTFTAVFWFKVNDVNGVQTFLGQNWEEGPSFYTYLWEGTLGAAIYFEGEGIPFQIWANGCSPGLWYHAALVYNGSAAQIFVNGALVSTVPKTGVLLKNTTPFYVGARKNTEYMRGALDDVRIYRRALNASEISSLASQLSSPPSSPTLLSPANNAIDQVAPITIQWSPSATATRYHVQVGTSLDLTPASRIVDDSSRTTTSFTTAALAPATTYHWHVRAGNAAGWSDWSPTWSFTTGGVSSVSDDISNDPIDREEIYDQLGRLVATSVNGVVSRTSLGDGLYMSVEHRGARIVARSFIHVR